MKFAHLLVSAYFVERPEVGPFVEAPAEVVFERSQRPTRHDRVRTSAVRDTNREQRTASIAKGR
jgi:hypothetical protein